MPISAKLPGLREPGTYAMYVIEVSKDPSKSGYPMLTLLWKEIDGERGVKEWFAFLPKEHKASHITPERLAKLKMALGLPTMAKGEDFIGKRALVTLRMGKPNAEGKTYTEVHFVAPLKEQNNEAPSNTDYSF